MILLFFQWVMTYAGVLTNLHGPDRDEAVKAMQNDNDFDRWLAQYEQKMKQKMAETHNKSNKGGVRISQEQYLARHAKVIGGEEDQKEG